MFPGLKDNALWERAWRSHGALSLSRISARPERDRMAELLDQSCEIVRQQFALNQFTVDRTRHADAGSSACARIASRLATDYVAGRLLSDDLLNESKMRRITLAGVQECDVARKVNGEFVIQCCLSHRVDLLMTDCEFIFSQEELSRSISCQRPKHAICVTGQIPSDSRRFVSATGDTVTIFVDAEVLTFHDSHKGVTVQVQGRGIRAAEALVHELYNLFIELGCATTQLEIVHCFLGCSEQARNETIEALTLKVEDNRNFLDMFLMLAPVITERWMEKLHNMGDVEGCFLSYSKLRTRSYQVTWMPHWFLPSLFFVMHQWRFTECMSAFVDCCLDRHELWEEGIEESVLEKRLHEAMHDITETLTAVWVTMTDGDSPSAEYIREREVIPNQLLQYIGGYANGPRYWQWNLFPFRLVGSQLSSLIARVPADPKNVRWSLAKLLTGAFLVGKYTLTHKMRTFQICEGHERSCADDWHLGHDMSDCNYGLWKALGKPTAQEFDHLLGRPLPVFSKGYSLCFIGGVVGKFVEEADDKAFMTKLRTLPSLPNKWLSPALKLEKHFTPKLKRRKQQMAHGVEGAPASAPTAAAIDLLDMGAAPAPAAAVIDPLGALAPAPSAAPADAPAVEEEENEEETGAEDEEIEEDEEGEEETGEEDPDIEEDEKVLAIKKELQAGTISIEQKEQPGDDTKTPVEVQSILENAFQKTRASFYDELPSSTQSPAACANSGFSQSASSSRVEQAWQAAAPAAQDLDMGAPASAQPQQAPQAKAPHGAVAVDAAQMSLPKKPVGGGYDVFRSQLRCEAPETLAGLSASQQARKAKELWEAASDDRKHECEVIFQIRLGDYLAACDAIPEPVRKRLRQADDEKQEPVAIEDGAVAADGAQMSLPKKPVGGGYGVFRSQLRCEAPETLAGLSASQQACKAKELWGAASDDRKQQCEVIFQQRLADYHAQCDAIPEPVRKRLRANLRKSKLDAQEREKPTVPVGGGFGVFSLHMRTDDEFISEVHNLPATQQAKWLKSLWDRLPGERQSEFDCEFRRQLAEYHAAK